MYRIIVLVAATLLITSNAIASNSDLVWQWYTPCGNRILLFEIRLDGRLIRKFDSPICQVPFHPVLDNAERKSIDFKFLPRVAIKFSGYRYPAVTAPTGKPLEILIWQGGTDSRFLIIGVAVVNDTEILMKTFHIASPNKKSSSEIGKGLNLITIPVIKHNDVRKPQSS